MKTIERLKAAVAGLLYTSESDYQFEVSELAIEDSPTCESMGELFSEATVKEQDFDEWMAQAITQAEAYNSDEKHRWETLSAVIGELLSDVKVFRIGDSAQIKVAVLGREFGSDTWVMLQTISVET